MVQTNEVINNKKALLILNFAHLLCSKYIIFIFYYICNALLKYHSLLRANARQIKNCQSRLAGPHSSETRLESDFPDILSLSFNIAFFFK